MGPPRRRIEAGLKVPFLLVTRAGGFRREKTQEMPCLPRAAAVYAEFKMADARHFVCPSGFFS
jgi:hypothetical protein